QATITEICRRLDGIPLAIELAATRAAHLSLTEILERLNDRFRLLVGGRRRIQRQQTLTAALDWSYDLLGPDERLVLRRLAVFRTSFSLRAAEAICHPKAMELLGSLVAKSLVSVTDDGEDVRYRLLESVRIYAEGKLVESGESEQVRSAHRDFYLEWVEAVPIQRLGAPGSSALVTEADNLTAALEWCHQQDQYGLCARIAVRMTNHWFAFVKLSEMTAWWRELDAGLPAEDRDHRAMALVLRGQAALLAGEWEELNGCGAQAAALADPRSWLAGLAQSQQAVYWSYVDPPRSERFFQRLFDILSSNGMSPSPSDYESFYLLRLWRASDSEEALALLNDWRADLRDSTPTHSLAGAFAFYGDTRAALELRCRDERHAVPLVRFVHEFCEAVVTSAQGQFDEAEHHLATLTAVARDFAIPQGEASCLIGFAKVAFDRGDHVRSSRLLAAVRASVVTEDEVLGPENRIHLAGPTSFNTLVYEHSTRVLRDVLDAENARITETEGSALSLKEALDAELIRSATTAVANPAN
ncbi:MAG: hypothetical protein J2P57_18090, partial [Acidimicrobiaceae bacterium]|nr:hypothetical protein [Acidimicrobiaceae bacterium]